MVKPEKSRIGIVSGRYPASVFHSNINHKLYADRFGYTYIYCNFPTRSTNPYMNKIYYLAAYVHLFDYLFWIDDDAFFFDFDRDIAEYLPKEECFLSCCSSPDFKELKTIISSGQFFLKCNETGREFLSSVIGTDLAMVKNWWQPRHGFFSNGDQDAMVYLMEEDSRFVGKVAIHNYQCFNSRPENLLTETENHRPLVLHFTGRKEVKWANYRKVQKRFALDSSLVPSKFTVDYLFLTSPRDKRGPLLRLLSRCKVWVKKILTYMRS